MWRLGFKDRGLTAEQKKEFRIKKRQMGDMTHD
jgi:hypothetical protein